LTFLEKDVFDANGRMLNLTLCSLYLCQPRPRSRISCNSSPTPLPPPPQPLTRKPNPNTQRPVATTALTTCPPTYLLAYSPPTYLPTHLPYHLLLTTTEYRPTHHERETTPGRVGRAFEDMMQQLPGLAPAPLLESGAAQLVHPELNSW
jgi:hypothetical protein